MNQEEIAAFLMIVNCKSISLAAEKLYISQPALSNRLRTLEEKLGYSLIKRKKGGHYITLTDEGRAFIPIAKKSQQLWLNAQNIPEQINQNVLRVVAVKSISSYVLPNVVRAYLEDETNVSLRVLTCTSEEGSKRVASGMADLAIVTSDIYDDALEMLPAYSTKMVCVSGKDSSSASVVDIKTLDPDKEIQVPWFADYDNWRRNTVPLPSSSRIMVGSMSIMESLINDDYWCLMPSTIAYCLRRKDVVISRISDSSPEQQMFCLKRQGDMSESMRAFLKLFHLELESLKGTVSYLGNI